LHIDWLNTCHHANNQSPGWTYESVNNLLYLFRKTKYTKFSLTGIHSTFHFYVYHKIIFSNLVWDQKKPYNLTSIILLLFNIVYDELILASYTWLIFKALIKRTVWNPAIITMLWRPLLTMLFYHLYINTLEKVLCCISFYWENNLFLFLIIVSNLAKAFQKSFEKICHGYVNRYVNFFKVISFNKCIGLTKMLLILIFHPLHCEFWTSNEYKISWK
jgi:hypothetical protein